MKSTNRPNNPRSSKRSFSRRKSPAASKFILAAGISALVAAPNLIHAATYTWDSAASGGAPVDGTGAWSTGTANWWNGTTDIAWTSSTDTAVFGVNNGTAGTVTVGAVSVGAMTFNSTASGNYTLSSGTITLGGTMATITANTGATIGSLLTGTAGMTKAGAGTLTLTNSNSYTGATKITSGTLALTGGGALPLASAITINGGTLDMGSQTAVNNLGNNTGVTFGASGGTLNGSGTLNISGTGNGATGFTVPANATAVVNENILLMQPLAGYQTLASVGAGANLTINGVLKATGTNGSSEALWLSGGTLTLTNTANSFNGFNINGSAATTVSAPSFAALSSSRLLLEQHTSDGAATMIYTGTAVSTSFAFQSGGLYPGVTNNGSGTVTFTASPFLNAYGSNGTSGTSAINQTLTLGGSADIAVSGGISDVNTTTPGAWRTNLIKTGADTLILGGATTYTGTTTISGGTLQIGAGSTAGSISGSAGAIVDNATLAFNRTNTLTQGTDFPATISGTGSVVQAGSGLTILSGSNSYTGTTIVSSGTLQIGASGTTGSLSPSSAITDNGVLVFNRSNLVTQGTDFAATITGSGGLTQAGAGTLILNSSNSFTGATKISSGTLQIGAGGTAGSLSTSSTITDNSALVFNRSDTLAQGTGFAANILGTGSLTQAGAGTLILSSSNSYSGGTIVASGSLQLGNAAALGAVTGSLAVNGGTLDLDGNSLSVGALSGNSGAAITTSTTGSITLTASSATSSTYAGSIRNDAGTLSLNKAGTGTLTLAGSNSYTGPTTISSGTLQVGGGGTTGSLSPSSAITDNAVLVFNRADTITQGTDFAANISGTGSLAQSGAGTLTLTSSNSYTGATKITSGTLALTGGGALPVVSAITINGGTLDMGAQNAANNLGNNTGITFGNSGGTLNGSGTLSIVGTSAGANGLTVPTGATAVVNENILLIQPAGGYQQLASVGSGANLTINGVLRATGTNGSLEALWLSGGGTLILTNTANSFNGFNINGSTATAVSTPSFATLGGSSYRVLLEQHTSDGPATCIYTGTAVSTSTAFQSGGYFPSVLNNGSGTVTFTASSFMSAYITGTNATNQTLTLGGSAGITVSGVISDANTVTAGAWLTNLIKTGSATLTLGGANTYTGTTTISGGTLQIGAGSTSGSISGSAGAIVDNATLAFNRTNTLTQGTDFPTTISGSGNVVQAGSGTTVLSGSNNYSGGTIIANGTLRISNTNALGTGATAVNGGILQYPQPQFLTSGTSITINSGGALSLNVGGTNEFTSANLDSVFSGSSGVTFNAGSTVALDTSNAGGTFTYTSVISGTQGISKLGTGNLGLSSSNTYLGATQLSVGTINGVTLANGGQPSSLGASGNAASNLVFGASAGSGSTILSCTGAGSVNTDRLFTLGSQLVANGTTTLDNSGGGTLSFTNPGTIAVSATVATTLAFTGSSAIVFAPVLGNGSGTVALNASLANVLTLTGNNTYTGSTTVSSGTLQIGNSGTTGAIGSTSGVSLASGALLAFNRTDNYGGSFAKNVSGAGNLALNSGTLTLTGSNTFSGATTVASGAALQVGDGSSGFISGTGAVTVNTGATFTVNLANSGTLGSFINSAGGAVNFIGSGTNTIAGQISGYASGTVNQSGTGTTILINTNQFNGTTNITAGVLQLSSLNSAYNMTVNVGSGGTLAFGSSAVNVGALAGSGSVVLLNGGSGVTLTDGSNGQSTVFSGNLSGANGALVMNGTGALALTGSSSYSGGTTVVNGTLLAGNTYALGTGTTGVSAGGTLQYQQPGFLPSASAITVNSGGTLGLNVGGTNEFASTDLDSFFGGSGGVTFKAGSAVALNTNNAGGTFAYGSVISGTQGITKVGSGTLVLSNSSSYLGATTITGGTLALSGSGALPLASAITINGGTFDIGSQTAVNFLGNNTGITFSANGGTINGSGTLSIVGVGGGSYGFTVSASATAVVNANVLLSNTANYNYQQVASVGSNGNLTINGKITGPALWLSGGTLTLTNGSNAFNYFGIGGSGGIITAPNFAALGTAQNITLGQYGSPATLIYTGTTATTPLTLNDAILAPSIFNNGSGTATFSNATFIAPYTNQTSGTQTLTIGGSANIAISGVINDANSNHYGCPTNLLKTGANTLIFGGSNAYTGTTTITGGTLQIGAGGTTGSISGSAGAIINNATLAFNRSNTLTQSTDFPATISGTGSVVQAGSGTTVLSGSNSYSGGTTVVSGTLRVASVNALGTGAATVNGGTLSLNVGGTNEFTSSNLSSVFSGATFNAGSTVALDTSNAGGAFTYGGAISGTQGITKAGSGSLVLSGSNTYGGPTTIAGGTLQLGNGGTTGSLSPSSVITNNSALVFNRSDTITQGTDLAAAISGSGSLTQAGAGTVVLTSANSYTGATAITSGTLSLSGSGTLPLASAITINGGTLDLGSHNATNNLGNNTGVNFGANGGSLIGTGTLTIVGSNGSATGLTVAAGGTAVVNEAIVLSNTAGFTWQSLANVGSGANLTINGKIGGTSQLWLYGGGTVTLTNTNNSIGSVNFWPGAGPVTTLTTANFATLGTGKTMTLGQTPAQGPATFIYTGTTTSTSFYFQSDDLAPSVLNNGSGTVTFNGGSFNTQYTTMSSGTNQTFTIGGSADIAIQGVIHDAVSVSGTMFRTNLAKTSADTLTLSGSNTYSGVTTINGGTLQIGNANALGTGGLTVNGGALDLHGNSVSVPAFSGTGGAITNTVSGTGTLTTAVASGTATYAGNITDGTGAVVLTDSGAGTLILSGSITMAGLTVSSSGGTVQLAQSGSIGAVNVGAGATLSMVAHSGSTYHVLDISSLTLSGSTAGPAIAAYTPVGALAQQNAGVLTDKGIAVAQAAASSAIEPASPEAVPEPGTLGLLLAGASAMLGLRRKAKRSIR